jgi:asparaginyl-tRNA synthetase
MPSFRGEDADATHLCQFFHSEAEIVGGLDDVIRVVEDYIRFLAQRLLAELASEIRSVAGDLTSRAGRTGDRL